MLIVKFQEGVTVGTLGMARSVRRDNFIKYEKK